MNRRPSLFASLVAIFAAVIVLSAAGIVWLRARPPAQAVAGVEPPLMAATSLPAASPSSTTPLPATATPTVTATHLPTAEPSPTVATPETYVVQDGDTLVAIAARFGLSLEALADFNNLLDPNQIVAGSVLRLPPVGQPDAPTATPPATALSVTGGAPPTAEVPAATPLPTASLAAALPVTPFAPGALTLGVSFEGRPIERYVFGDGPIDVVFVGAIHGGYEWNTGNLAYEMIAYFGRNPGSVPDEITLHIIPVANPDGMARVAEGWTSGPIPPPTGVITATYPGRFNGRDVDLNRNWDCNWEPKALWRDQEVDAGSEPFSESEVVALRDFLLNEEAQAVVFWHSAAGIVLPGGCQPDTHPPSLALAEVYSDASGYPVQASLTYTISGDAGDWLTAQDIASIAIELTNHTAMDWDKNINGTLAVLNYCAAGACGAAE